MTDGSLFLVEESHPLLDFRPEMSDESLHWPGSGISQRADRVAFNLFGQLPQRVNFVGMSVSLDEPARLAKTIDKFESFFG